jgi:long-chain fatty acid transport protein
MQKIMTPRLIPALLAIAFAGGAHASGFQLLGEQSASGIGNAGAGSEAVAENASTIYYNPAGMTQLQAREVSAGLSAVKIGFKFEDGGSVAPGLSGDGGDAGGWAVVPNGYVSWALNKDLYLGFGFGAPFGLATEYDDPWVGSAHSISFDIKTINLNPSIAWRANEWLSLGAGINYQMIEAEYVSRAAAACNPAGLQSPNPAVVAATRRGCAATGTKGTLEIDDGAWGWNVGALFTLAPQTKVGVSYRSSIKYETKGDVKFSGPAAAALGNSGAKADVELPDTFILSVSQGIGSQWELLGDISWTGWSSIPELQIKRSSGAALQTLDTAFEDSWRFAVGANYKLSDAVKLRFGIAYDETPVPNEEKRLVSLPDNDRIWFSTGVQWKPQKNMALDVGLAYIDVRDTEINNDQRPTKGLVKGDYDSYSFILGGQFSMAF